MALRAPNAASWRSFPARSLGKKDIDADVLEELEEALITSDIGVGTTTRIIERIEERTSRESSKSIDLLLPMLREEIAGMLEAHRGDGHLQTSPSPRRTVLTCF